MWRKLCVVKKTGRGVCVKGDSDCKGKRYGLCMCVEECVCGGKEMKV